MAQGPRPFGELPATGYVRQSQLIPPPGAVFVGNAVAPCQGRDIPKTRQIERSDNCLARGRRAPVA